MCADSSSTSIPRSSPLSEPPEAHVDNEHDEEHAAGGQLGVGGAGVQILGVPLVLLGEAGQVAGLGVQRCREDKTGRRGRKRKIRGGSRAWTRGGAVTFNGSAREGLTGESLSSLQHLLDVGHHDPLDVLQLRVDAAQVPPRSAVNVRLLGFLDVGVWGGQEQGFIQHGLALRSTFISRQSISDTKKTYEMQNLGKGERDQSAVSLQTQNQSP